MRQRPRTVSSRRAPARPLRVAIVCSQLEIGGQETGIVELLRQFDSRRIVPKLYTFRGGPLLGSIRRLGVPVLVGSRRANTTGRWTETDRREKVAFRIRLADAFRRDRIDVCLVYAWADAVSAAREAGVPAIVERVDGPKLIGWVSDKSSLQRVICESRAIRRLLQSQREWLRLASIPIAVVRNGIDLDTFNPERRARAASRRALNLRPDDFVIGAIARLAPVKNLGHLLEATRLFVESTDPLPRVRVLIAGPEGGAGPALRKQVRELKVSSYVKFLGARSDVPRILRALDVFVMTSIQEGAPFAMLEAMAMGLPIVASQADSIAELVRDNGFLVSPVDPYRTTVAFRMLVRHEGLRLALGRRSRRLALGYGLDRMVREYERQLIAAYRTGRQRAPFRRRIAVMPGHSRRRSAGKGAIDHLFDALRRNGVDAYRLAPSRNTREVTAWPPKRRQMFPRTAQGKLARRSCLEWIQPDVVVTDCPKIVQLARGVLPGEEIVFVDSAGDPCPGRARAMRAADHVVPADRLSAAHLVALLGSNHSAPRTGRRWG